MTIPFIDLKAQYNALKTEIDARIEKVLSHGNFIMGPEIEELENKLADYVGVKHAIACSSGTDALLMSLMSYGIGPGDAVFTTPFTFIATAEVIALLGATPVFVDIDPLTFNMDPDQLKLAIQKVVKEKKLRARAVIPVDLFGLPADYDTIMEAAGAYDLFVLEDAAQGFGGVYKGRRAGSFGHAAATSFFPAKPLGCYGDGGAVFTDNDDLAKTLESIRVHGKGSDKYDNIRIGINGRLDTLQAAILLPKLEAFPAELEKKRNIALQYSEGLRDVVQVPHIPEGYESAWAQFSVLTEDRDKCQALMKAEGIPTAIYYPKPLHLQTAFSYLGYRKGDMPHSEVSSQRIFSLPMHPYLKDDQINKIVDTLKKAAG
ncbi:MAG: aminotransferase DegT [Nitrospirae bacterium CG17_big_fil_post_rev_8_21_14_2_50_50_9]|nr:MAG: aminotransferase DegT [Nitrospirae bacterium CG17_big_fil_post_rev_8_21_14_2_50_50_9]